MLKSPPKVESTYCFEYFTVNSKNTTTQMSNTSLYFMLHNCDLHVFHRKGRGEYGTFQQQQRGESCECREKRKAEH